MKKKLEAELISIAHRILQLKNKSDLAQLHQETQKLYEKLSILRFIDEHFEGAKPTIGRSEVSQKLETLFDAPTEVSTGETTETPKEIAADKKEKPETVIADPEMNSPIQEKSVEPVNETVAQKTETNEAEPVLDLESDVEAVSDIEMENSDSTEEAMESPTFEPLEELEEDEPAEEVNISEPPIETNEPEEIKVAEEPAKEASTDKPDSIYDAEVKAIEAIAKSNDSFFKPSFELAFDAKEEKETPKIPDEPSKPIVFEDFLGKNYVDPVFVKPEELNNTTDKTQNEPAIPIGRNTADISQVISLKKDNDNNTQTLNDRMSKGITIGLNDRIAFMKHLFNNSSEDYNRVLSQLITFDTLSEATNFIDTMVKPDYNNWEGKEEYSQRFMEIIEKKFA